MSRGKLLLAWLLLSMMSIVSGHLLNSWGVPSGYLLGPMLAAVVVILMGMRLRTPKWSALAVQATLGCVVAKSLSWPVLNSMAAHWAPVIGAVLSTTVISCVLAWSLGRRESMGRETAAWGSMPGAAGMMMALAAANGGDARMVALMQYVRVTIVVMSTSIVTTVFATLPAGAAAVVASQVAADIGFLQVAGTVLVAVVGAAIGTRIRMPAAPFLVVVAIGAVVQLNGWLSLALPQWLLIIAYGVLGWHIGLQFERALFKLFLRSLPAIVGSSIALVLVCSVVGYILARLMNTDMLTGFLATSPGSIESIVVIGAQSTADMSIVMPVQTLRFIAIVVLSPWLVSFVCGIPVRKPALK